MNLSRSTRCAVVPTLFAALTLSACQDEAPTAAPPSPVSPSAAPTTAQAAPSSTSAPTPTSEPSAAPSTSGGAQPSSAPAGAGCTSRDLFKIQRRGVTPKPRTEPQTAQDGSDAVELTIGAPTADTSSGTSYFPGDGFQTVVFPVSIKATAGSYVISELHFGLADPADQPCKVDIGNVVVPGSDEIGVKILRAGDQYSGKIGFAVPAGADISKYTVLYSKDYHSGSAQLAWYAK